MRVLISGSGGKFGRVLTDALSRLYEVQTLHSSEISQGSAPTFDGDARWHELAQAAVNGCDAVVHFLSPEPGASPLDTLDRATRGVYNLALSAAPTTRLVLIGSLSFFERCPPEWNVTELWEPRPTSAVNDLAPYLGERTAREVLRSRDMIGTSLRLSTVVDDEDMRGQTPDPRWLHVEDAVQAVEKAVAWMPPAEAPQSGFWVFHIVGGGKRTRFPLAAARKLLGYAPQHDLSSEIPLPLAWDPALSPKNLSEQPGGNAYKVVIFGAGGALAGAVAANLQQDHVLHLSDARSIAEALQNTSPKPGVPRPQVLPAPHEEMRVDITDPQQVLEATRGMEAIINCTVVRYDPVESFRVNTLGAYNIAQAAVTNGIRRIVHTGNPTISERYPSGYWQDFRLPATQPPRPGTSLYNLSKYLGYEVLRIFAEEYALEVPVLCFYEFVDASLPKPPPQAVDKNTSYPVSFDSVAYCHAVSWNDATQALRLALHAPSFPHPLELMHILTDLPQGKYSNEATKRLLGWEPQDSLEAYWLRDFS